MSSDAVSTRCFLSYARVDNDDFLQVVDRIKSELAGRFHAETGRPLEIFLDRDSIGWGEQWRDRIRGSVIEATFFVPVITMRYFDSEMCREELSTYFENARQLGVAELIVPIVLAGASQLRSDHPDELVRLIEGINYISISAPWERGYESPEWRAAINRMVAEIAAALGRAEDALASREASLPAPGDSEVDDSTLDIEALNTELTEAAADIQASLASMQALTESFTSLGAQTQGANSPAQRQAMLVRSAQSIASAGSEFQGRVVAMERKVIGIDARLRAIFQELGEIDLDQARESLAMLRTPIQQLPDMGDNLAAIDTAVSGLRLAAMSSVAIRKALAPVQQGLRAFRNAFETMESWRVL